MASLRHNRPFRWILRIVGLAVAAWALAPFYWPTWGFVPLATDPRVRYEPGAEQTATLAAQALPAAIPTIERAQGRPFARPVTVFVCATQRSFEHHGYGIVGAAGFVFNGRLFLSPKLEKTPDRVPRVLTHELSHLHLEQCRGMLATAAGLPGWFKEGLAVYVSGGGGAETVSEAEASDAISHGRLFRPDVSGHLFFPQTGARDGLKPHLFYRESAMFVAYLARTDPAAFNRMLTALEDGDGFAATIEHEYGRTVARIQQDFVAARTGLIESARPFVIH